jgi:hypothetical protein
MSAPAAASSGGLNAAPPAPLVTAASLGSLPGALAPSALVGVSPAITNAGGFHPCSMKGFVDDLRPLADSMGLNAMAPQNDRNAGAGGVLDKVASTARVGAIEFSMLRGHEINKLSQVHVVSKSLYELNRAEPQPWGCLDRRMGISTKKAVCLTCFKQLADCIGHFGHIDLELPVFHIGYIKEVQRVLQATCKTCSRVLLAPLERKHYLQLMNRVEDRKYRAAIANVSSIAPAIPRIRGCSRLCGRPLHCANSTHEEQCGASDAHVCFILNNGV